MKNVIDWSKAPDNCLGAVHLKDEYIEGGDDYGIFVTKTKGLMNDNYHYCGVTNVGPQIEKYVFTPKPESLNKVVTDWNSDLEATHFMPKVDDYAQRFVKITGKTVERRSKGEWVGSTFTEQELIAKGLIKRPSEPEAKPVFTQEMLNDGILPSVGMSCMIYYNESNSRFNDFFDVEIEILAVTGDVFTFINPIHGLGALKLNTKQVKPLPLPITLKDKALYLFDVGNKSKVVGEAYHVEFENIWMINALRTNSSYKANDCTNIIGPLVPEVKK